MMDSELAWSSLLESAEQRPSDATPEDLLAMFLNQPMIHGTGDVAAASNVVAPLVSPSAATTTMNGGIPAPFIPYPDYSFAPDYSLLNLSPSALTVPPLPESAFTQELLASFNAADHSGDPFATISGSQLQGNQLGLDLWESSESEREKETETETAKEVIKKKPQGEADIKVVEDKAPQSQPESSVGRKASKKRALKAESEEPVLSPDQPATVELPVTGTAGKLVKEGEEWYKKHSRGTKACVRCRKQKMRCIHNNEARCQRCIRQKAECVFADIVHGTQPDPPKPVKKQRAASISKPTEIANDEVTSPDGSSPATSSSSSTPLIRQIPLPLIASSSHGKISSSSKSDSSSPGDSTKKKNVKIPPTEPVMDVLKVSRVGRCMEILTAEQVEDLFAEFYRSVNPSWQLLEAEWHTPAMVGARSPLLLLSICTITSRFHPPTQHLYSKLYTIAREDAAAALVDGVRAVETVQACLLLAMWAVHPAGTAQDIGWMLVCFASRLAADLGLQRPKPASSYSGSDQGPAELENANRIRTWMLCYALDRSYSLQRGRVASLSCRPAQIAQISATAKAANPTTIGIVGYMDLQTLASEAIETLQWSDGLVDFGGVTAAFEAKVAKWQEGVISILNKAQLDESVNSEQLSYFYGIFDFYRDYWCLVVFSFGLQNSLDNESLEVAYFFLKCASFANSMLKGAHERLSAHPYFQKAPDSRFVFLTYAAVCLMKFAQPTFQRFCPPGSEMSPASICQRVLRLADLLQETAVDAAHMPAICAAFLRTLVKEASKTVMAAPPAHATVAAKKESQVGSATVEPLVVSVLRPESWHSMVVPGFEGRERPSTANFLRSELTASG
ncbi:hypothetical protein T439DRAFT_329874 [Meredithblackwellia eburnea MCA 4105]